jgi:hypothetical protein
MFGLTGDEDTRQKIQQLLCEYSKPLPQTVYRQLDTIRKLGLRDEALIHRPMEVYEQYRIADIKTENHQVDKTDYTSIVVCKTKYVKKIS